MLTVEDLVEVMKVELDLVVLALTLDGPTLEDTFDDELEIFDDKLDETLVDEELDAFPEEL